MWEGKIARRCTCLHLSQDLSLAGGTDEQRTCDVGRDLSVDGHALDLLDGVGLLHDLGLDQKLHLVEKVITGGGRERARVC